MKNNKLKNEETKKLGRLITAVSVVGFLHGSIDPSLSAFLATLGIIASFFGLSIKNDENIVETLKSLTDFREVMLGSIIISWATGAFVFTANLGIILYMIFITAIASSILAKTRNKKSDKVNTDKPTVKSAINAKKRKMARNNKRTTKR
ncbi:hypothetical protein [Pseudoalteromonas marina]|uniref:Uncharacterized protein n=1 Tax=Pseudoalteromonas marina TaxID=267375 RepID=A0ABT9FCC2_9GAMM|nr:hypothetical protein [Pseudoalteromonas marina]MDP2564428.1 hypothetical protein [Pseudoalteromonas marina]